MKPFLYIISILLGSLSVTTGVLAQDAPPQELLQQMEQAGQSLNYELAYINVSRLGIESLRYRHTVIDGKIFAQLLPMDGPRSEVIQRDKNISYFESGMEPFALTGNYIVDALPSVVHADFNHLADNYNFISVGRSRVADQLCEVVRIVSRDGARYSYIVWLDSETRLPLRVDLMDSDGETLEQYRVVSFAVDERIGNLMRGLEKAKLPSPLTVPADTTAEFIWKPHWLPAGMKEIARGRRSVAALQKPVESRFYSDGLFSFSINVRPADKSSTTQLLRTGRRTIQILIRNNSEIMVIGELPPATVKRIADNLNLGTQ